MRGWGPWLPPVGAGSNPCSLFLILLLPALKKMIYTQLLQCDLWNIPSPATLDLDLASKPLISKCTQKSVRGPGAHLDYAEGGGICHHGL